jgi:hypothetical protein
MNVETTKIKATSKDSAFIWSKSAPKYLDHLHSLERLLPRECLQQNVLCL